MLKNTPLLPILPRCIAPFHFRISSEVCTFADGESSVSKSFHYRLTKIIYNYGKR